MTYVTVVVALSFGTQSLAQVDTTRARDVGEAWDALNQAKETRQCTDYMAARDAGEYCWLQYRGLANRIQSGLTGSDEPLPRCGTGHSVQEIARINGWGPVNDVAACLFVKLASEVALGDADAAHATQDELENYSHSATWDPSWSGFWCPIEAGEDEELPKLDVPALSCRN
jgi:hypothetical protein